MEELDCRRRGRSVCQRARRTFFSRGTLAPFEPTLLCLPAIANSEFLNGPRFLVACRAVTASAGCREGAVVHLGRNPEEDVAKLRASALVRPVPNRPYQPSDPQGFPILGMGRSVNSKTSRAPKSSIFIPQIQGHHLILKY